MTDYSDIIGRYLSLNNMEAAVSPQSQNKLSAFLNELLRVNAYMNLTAIKDAEDVVLKHFIDSLTLLPYIPRNANMIDIGSGAGFPALPVAVTRPDVRICALDSTSKKVSFIRNSATLLELKNVETLSGRAEDLSHSSGYREKFDVSTARAVARLNILCELCMPFIRIGGIFISMKSRLASEEFNEARQAIKTLGGELAENITVSLKGNQEDQERSLIIIQKIRPTPILYPRNNSQINKMPL